MDPILTKESYENKGIIETNYIKKKKKKKKKNNNNNNNNNNIKNIYIYTFNIYLSKN